MKNFFLLVTKRALASLSFMANLRNGNEVEDFRFIGFKLDVGFFSVKENTLTDTYPHTLPYF